MRFFLSLWSWAEIAGAGADQDAALVLLDRVSNPANRAADNEQSEPGTPGELQRGRGRGEGKIDIGPAPNQAEAGGRRHPRRARASCARRLPAD